MIKLSFDRERVTSAVSYLSLVHLHVFDVATQVVDTPPVVRHYSLNIMNYSKIVVCIDSLRCDFILLPYNCSNLLGVFLSCWYITGAASNVCTFAPNIGHVCTDVSDFSAMIDDHLCLFRCN